MILLNLGYMEIHILHLCLHMGGGIWRISSCMTWRRRHFVSSKEIYIHPSVLRPYHSPQLL